MKRLSLFIIFLFALMLACAGGKDDGGDGGNTGGGESGTGTATVSAISTLPEVTMLKAVPKDSRVDLSWDDPSVSALAGIQVIWLQDGTAKSVLVRKGDEVCTITALRNGTTYDFTVKTIDGDGLKSAGVTIPSQPNANKIDDVGSLGVGVDDLRVLFKWKDPDEADFDHVEITWSPDGSAVKKVAKGIQTYTTDPLANGTKYVFLIKAVGISGYQSNGVSVLTSTEYIRPVVVAGVEHSMYILTDRQLWLSGSNAMGQFGNGVQDPYNENPIKATSRLIKATAGGYSHSLILEKGGDLWATGENTYGQLGDGTKSTRLSPVKMATGVKAVAAGYRHSYFLRTDGTLWAMGLNSYGRLGDGTTTDRTSPVQIATGVSAIASGSAHGLFVKTDGTLWAMGANGAGALGDGTKNERHYPVPVMTGVSAVASGAAAGHSLVLKTDGTLYGMGSNQFGQLGLGDSTDRLSPVRIMSGVKKMAAGTNHSLIVTTNGKLYAMGSNVNGQLGDGTSLTRYSPVQIMSGVYDVAAGGNFSIIVKTDNTIWTAGLNSYGQLGDGSFAERHAPVKVNLVSSIGANIRSMLGKRTTIFIAIGAAVFAIALIVGINVIRRRRAV